MLNKLAFANSIAVLTAALYVFFAIVALISTRAFRSAIRCTILWRQCRVTLPEGSTLRRFSRDAGAYECHVMGRGLRVGVAVQSVRKEPLSQDVTPQTAKERRRCPEAANLLSATTGIPSPAP